MKIVAYSLHGQDNDSYMFKDDSCLQKCNGCGYRLDFAPTNTKYVLNKGKDDFSATYDGQYIVTKAFKEFCEQNEYKDVLFKSFENDPQHFHFIVKTEIKFDAVRRKTRFENLCPECGNYESVVGATPAYLLIKQPLKDGFYRSDLLFASGNEKSPLIFVGVKNKSKLEAAGLNGLEFAPVNGID